MGAKRWLSSASSTPPAPAPLTASDLEKPAPSLHQHPDAGISTSVRGDRRLRLRIAATWPWATQITAAITRLRAFAPS